MFFDFLVTQLYSFYTMMLQLTYQTMLVIIIENNYFNPLTARIARIFTVFEHRGQCFQGIKGCDSYNSCVKWTLSNMNVFEQSIFGVA